MKSRPVPLIAPIGEKTPSVSWDYNTVMRVWVYSIVRDEEVLITYFMRHYKTFCEKIILYDDESSDNTREIALSFGADVRSCLWRGLDDIKAIDFASQQYKEARNVADWVIWVDADEFIYHPKLVDKLDKYKKSGVTVPTIVGFNMVSSEPPSGNGQIYDLIKNGFYDPAYSKPCVFDPSIDITWTTGKHQAISSDVVASPTDPLKLLHYRYLGENWHLARNGRNYGRLNPENIQRQHGIETYPGYQGIHSPEWYEQQLENVMDCVS